LASFPFEFASRRRAGSTVIPVYRLISAYSKI
jgi:hypothetical protein